MYTLFSSISAKNKWITWIALPSTQFNNIIQSCCTVFPSMYCKHSINDSFHHTVYGMQNNLAATTGGAMTANGLGAHTGKQDRHRWHIAEVLGTRVFLPRMCRRHSCFVAVILLLDYMLWDNCIVIIIYINTIEWNRVVCTSRSCWMVFCSVRRSEECWKRWNVHHSRWFMEGMSSDIDFTRVPYRRLFPSFHCSVLGWNQSS